MDMLTVSAYLCILTVASLNDVISVISRQLSSDQVVLIMIGSTFLMYVGFRSGVWAQLLCILCISDVTVAAV